MAKLEITFKIYDKKDQSAMSTSEIVRTYDCSGEVLSAYIDGALVSIISGNPCQDLIANLNNDNGEEEDVNP